MLPARRSAGPACRARRSTPAGCCGRPRSLRTPHGLSCVRVHSPSLCLLTLYFLLGVSAGHQGGVGATGGGCRADTRGGVGLTPGPGNERAVAHRPSCLSQTWITLSGRRPPPIPLPSSSRCISLEPPPRRTPGEPQPLHRKGFRTLNARLPLLFLRVWHPLVGSTRPLRSSSPLSPSAFLLPRSRQMLSGIRAATPTGVIPRTRRISSSSS